MIVPALVGCERAVEDPLAFEPNLVHTTKYAIAEEVDMDQASEDAFWIVDRMFGTPDEPKLPAVFEREDIDLVSMDNLHRVSGPADAEGRGLYAQVCAQCHGVTGSGRGPIAAVQTPYPRDYRPGVFKFKSTERGIKPTKDDIAKLLRHGIGGTAMTAIDQLAGRKVTDEEVDALVDYVIYLSMRGEVERKVVDGAMFDGIITGGDRILNTTLASRIANDDAYVAQMEAAADADDVDEATEEELERFELNRENWEYAEDYAIEVAESWLDAEDEAIDAVEPPEDLPLAEDYADVVSLRNGDRAEAFAASVEHGRQLYLGKIASCAKCHGAGGLGDGQVTDYDDWTKDWTQRANLDPKDREALIPLLARGAMEPKNVLPRNFTEGVFRGGKSSEELYRRIVQGVDGTPMPAATFVEGEFEADDVWDVINFLRTLETPPSST